MGFVLGLNGPAGAGKDTIADYLVNEKGWTANISFAANLKEMCKAVFALSDYDVTDQDGKKKLFSKPKTFTDRNLGSVMYWMANSHPQTRVRPESMEKVRSLVGTELTNPRHVLQFVGTEICRELIPTYHVDVLVKRVKDDPNGLFVVSDARFPNEGDLILDELGGLVVYVDRPDPSAANINRSHASETAMLDWGRFSDRISNHREGLQNLFNEVDSFLERHNLCQDADAVTQSEKSGVANSSLTGEAATQSATGTTTETS